MTSRKTAANEIASHRESKYPDGFRNPAESRRIFSAFVSSIFSGRVKQKPKNASALRKLESMRFLSIS